MDTRKKACPNEQCKTYKKKKYSSKINYCPECGTELIYVCKSHNCYKPLDISSNEHAYCFECETKYKDAKDKIKEKGKLAVGGIALGIGAKAKKALENEGGKVAKEVVKKGVKAAADKIIKK